MLISKNYYSELILNAKYLLTLLSHMSLFNKKLNNYLSIKIWKQFMYKYLIMDMDASILLNINNLKY